MARAHGLCQVSGIGNSAGGAVMAYVELRLHEFSKQGTGLEADQVRNEDAVKRYFR